MDIGVITGLEYHIGRDVDLDGAISVHADIFKSRLIVYSCIFQILCYSYQNLSQVAGPDLVKQAYIFIGVLHEVSEAVVHEFVVEGVVGAVFGALVGFLGAASYDFAEADDVGVGEFDDLFQLLGIEVEVDDGFEEGCF